MKKDSNIQSLKNTSKICGTANSPQL